MSNQFRPPLPAEIARAVRRRCGFGCVICGKPIYQIHHVDDWAEVHEHQEDNLTLLCNDHHAEATKGLLTKDQVSRANANPLNVQNGVTAPYGLHFEGDSFSFGLGGLEMTFIPMGQLPALVIDGCLMLGVELDAEGGAYVHVSLFDECNHSLLCLHDNELKASAKTFDIQFVGQELTIRDLSKSVLLVLRFEPPGRIVVKQAVNRRFITSQSSALQNRPAVVVDLRW